MRATGRVARPAFAGMTRCGGGMKIYPRASVRIYLGVTSSF